MRKKLGKLLVLSMLVLTLTFGTVTPAFAKTVTRHVTGYVGQTYYISLYRNGKLRKGKYKSSKKRVAAVKRVGKKGRVKCKRRGKCTITARIKGYKVKYKLTVK